MTKERIIPTMGRNNCGGRCRILVHEKDGEIISIKGDPAHPDKMPCIRGLNYHKTFLGEDRLTTPMKRVGKRGEGKFVQISWEEAIDTITKEWIRIRDTYGVESRYVNYAWGISAVLSGLNLSKRLLALDGGYLEYYNSYSTACTNYTTPYLYGTEYSGSTYDTLMDSKFIILWAHNPQETRFDNLMYWLRKAKKNGTEIVVIDPRKNATATALDAEWIGIRPTTDCALMDAMAYVIWKEDLYDHFFVEERCLGFDKYFAYLDGLEDGIKKTPEWAAEITGVPVEKIVELAWKYGTSKPAALMQGYGGQRHMNGEQFTRGGVALACLTGNVGISGGWASGAAQCKTVDFPTLPTIENPMKKSISSFLWTDAIARWQDFGVKDGLKGGERLDCGIKMILNLAGNILINQHSDINRTKKILEDESLCEFIVCSDLFLTPSAMYADILLPGTSMFEGDNIVKPWNRGDYIGASNQILAPIGESRFEFDWLYEVAERLGLAEAFSEGHKDYRNWLRAIYDRYKIEGMPDYDTFKKEGIYVYPDSPTVIGFEAERRGEKLFATPSGKVEIYSPTLEAMKDARIPAVPGYVEVQEGPGKSEKYPLQLIGWHTLGRCHTVHFNNKELQEKFPQLLWMHPEDAACRGLANEDLVEVWNDRGKIVVPVLLTEEILPGVTAIAQGAWHKADAQGRDIHASINVLTTQEPTPLAKGNPQHTNLVEVRKLKLFCLIGSPVAHSLSPRMHNYSFGKVGLDCFYTTFDVKEDQVKQFLEKSKRLGIQGFNVTMPCKMEVARLVDELSPAAKIMQAVNTVVNENGRLIGHNTDGVGFVRNLEDHGIFVKDQTVTLLGGGGAATAIFVQLVLDGVRRICVFNRKGANFDKLRKIAEQLKDYAPECQMEICDFLDGACLNESIRNSDILVNATNVGMAPLEEQSPVADVSVLHENLVVAEIIYNPKETKLMKDARFAGVKQVVSGKGMLLWQGEEAFRLFTGKQMPVSEVKELFFCD